MSLAQEFGSNNGRKVRWNGKSVHSFLRLDVGDGDKLRLTRLGTSAVRAQALKVEADRGELRANGLILPAIAYWSHTAPDEVEIEIIGKKVRSVDLWNAWSFEGVDSAWLGNAGMIVESEGNAHLLRCSDGVGEASFDDLVVRVEHVRAS